MATTENKVTTIEWFRTLYPGDRGGHLVLWTRQDRRSEWFSLATLAGAAARAVSLAATRDVYFGIGLHPRQLGPDERGRGDGVSALPGLWLDLDVAGPAHQGDDLPPDREAARLILDAFPLPPTAVVDSGHGLQAWWLFPELWRFRSEAERKAAAELSRRFQAMLVDIARGMGWHVDSTHDLARVLRVPGTMNRKLTPVPVEVVDIDLERRYRPEDFMPHLVAVELVRAPAPAVEGNIAAQHRNTTLTSLAGTMRRRGMTQDAIEAALMAENAARCDPPLPDAEVRSIAASVAAYAPQAAPADRNGHGEEPLPEPPHEDAAVPGDDCDVDVGDIDVTEFFVDWSEFWDRSRTGADWLFDDVLARGRGHAIYASHKTGKSLLMLWLAVLMALRGMAIVYLDFEMGDDDLYERLADMGYGPDTDLSHLHYAVLPSLPPLDTDLGALTLLAKVDAVRAMHPEGTETAVIIDTTARAVAGEENSADTYRGFYRYTGTGLKRRGITWARLDHAGKDSSKGQRGSSAKGDDVDVVWRLARTDNGLELRRELSRPGWVPAKVAFRQLAEPLRFVRVAEDWPAGTAEVAAILDGLGVPVTAGERPAGQAMREAGHQRTQSVVRAAQKYRRQVVENGHR